MASKAMQGSFPLATGGSSSDVDPALNLVRPASRSRLCAPLVAVGMQKMKFPPSDTGLWCGQSPFGLTSWIKFLDFLKLRSVIETWMESKFISVSSP